MVSGSTLLRTAPMRAPAMVRGSITSTRSQSIRGLSTLGFGCRFGRFSKQLAMAPPNTVTLDSGMACLGEKPSTSA
jgi:hypothetical protein